MHRVPLVTRETRAASEEHGRARRTSRDDEEEDDDDDVEGAEVLAARRAQQVPKEAERMAATADMILFFSFGKLEKERERDGERETRIEKK